MDIYIYIYIHKFSVLFYRTFFLVTFYFIEKGKLKHATVSSEPGETKDIRSFKVSNLFSLYII